MIVLDLAAPDVVAAVRPALRKETARSLGSAHRWTPVKNLTFAADLGYVMLDQKYASGSTVTLPAQSGIAKPAGVYELKDQE
ncbi:MULTISPECIES: hypothetical protein [Bradyrhizobium]